MEVQQESAVRPVSSTSKPNKALISCHTNVSAVPNQIRRLMYRFLAPLRFVRNDISFKCLIGYQAIFIYLRLCSRRQEPACGRQGIATKKIEKL